MDSTAIRAIRKRLGLSQEDMARACGVSVSTIRAWEQGLRRPKGRSVQKLEALRDPPGQAAPQHRLRSPVKANPRRHPRGVPTALSAVSPEVKTAALEVHGALERLGLPHYVVGGIAVGAHGHPRATKDVDFLVGDEVFVFTRSGIVAGVQPGVPFPAVGSVAVDYLSPTPGTGEQQAIDRARRRRSRDLQPIPVEMLVRMKLQANRSQDRADVVNLVKAGVSLKRVRAYLSKVSPDLVDAFEARVAEAREERARERAFAQKGRRR